MSQRGGNLLQDLKWGLKWGLQIAVGFALIAIVFLTLNSLPPGPPASLPATPMSLLVLYFGTGVLSGSLVGLLRSKLAKRSTATCVGILAAVPWYFGIRVLAFGWESWSTFDLIFLVACPIIVGGAVTQFIWMRNHPHEGSRVVD
jgi:hypothetical protein